MQFSLKDDVERVDKLKSDIASELATEEKNFRALHETLQNIELKLKGAEELGAAVAELRQEFDELRLEILRHSELEKILKPSATPK